MRICFVSRRSFPTISGMSVYALNLLRQLERTGHDLTMVAQFRGDPRGRQVYGGGEPLPVPGVRVVGREALGEQDGGDFERDVDDLVATIEGEHQREPFDLLHAQYGYPPGLAVLEASRRLGVPSVVSIQGGDGNWVGSCCATHREAMRAVLMHAGAVLVGSDSFAAEVAANNDVPVERFTIVPGAVDTDRFRARPEPLLGALADPPCLLYHGRVDARKGVMDLLEAVRAVRAQRPVCLIVSGIGPDTDAVAARVEELGLRDTVHVTGYAAYEEVPDVYRRGDVFVSPTYAEGFSNTILEAMASGVPVVSCRSVGVVDCLRDGENGLLVEPGDTRALAGAIIRLLDDPDLRTRLADSAASEVRVRWSWPPVARQIESVYDAVRGTEPDGAWTMPAMPPAPCRFRETPHLL